MNSERKSMYLNLAYFRGKMCLSIETLTEAVGSAISRMKSEHSSNRVIYDAIVFYSNLNCKTHQAV